MISPFQDDVLFLKPAGEYRFGIHAYSRFFNIKAPALDLDTNRGLSLISVLLGSKREQLLFLDHHQRISRRMSGKLSYNSIVSPGFLLNSFAVHRGFRISMDYSSAFFNSEIGFNYAKIESDENGGLKDGQVIDGISRSDYEQLQTFLSDDRRKIRQYRAFLNNEVVLLNPKSNDSSTSFSLKLHADGEWFRWGTSYSGTADTVFYEQVLLDTAVTQDTAGYAYVKFRPAVGLSWLSKLAELRLKGGYSIYYLDQLIDTVKTENNYTAPFLDLNVRYDCFDAQLKWSTVVSTRANDGDFSIVAQTAYRNSRSVFSQLELSYGKSELAPEASSVFYRSNHFAWENEFGKENFTWLKSSLGLFGNRLSFSMQWTEVMNYVYLNDRARPVQAPDKVKVLDAYMKSDVSFRKWRLMADVQWMNSDRGYIRIPEFGVYGRLSFRDHFFKKALFAEFGMAYYTRSAWKAYAFMPATGMNYLQSGQWVADSPVLDVFVNAVIGRATLTFMMQRLNDGMFGGENYLARGYPAAPKTIKFGLLWKLYN
ncbi:MAG: hypothetical protein JNL88_03300 [Bacteroidia bacterium]|nr:hypothetical protein [Bacteroidia bacterium]